MRLVLPMILFSSLAAAQPTIPTMPTMLPSAHDLAAGDCARARAVARTCVLTLGAEQIEGQGLRPDGAVVPTRGFVEWPTLLPIRRDFLVELVHSASEL